MNSTQKKKRLQEIHNVFPRWSAVLLLTGFFVGSVILPMQPSSGWQVHAAPHQAAAPGDVVISEFRTTGPGGGYDEFVELFNRTNETIPIGNWQIKKSSGCGGASATPLVTIDAGVSLAPGQYYLIGKKPEYTGTVDQEYTSSSSIADDGGVALLDDVGAIIDQAGMCSTTAYLEGDPLAPLSGSSDRSYQRGDNGCTDTDDNNADFVLQTPADPQNSNDTPVRCLRVVNVTSTVDDVPPALPYVQDNLIPITIEFSSNVNVTDFPTLLLETGATDRTATYSSGSGSDTLTFDYTVQNGDVSADLDYVSTNSLSLNGGSIIGAVGDADLTLPSPGTPGSLGDNKDIVIDNQEAPSTDSFIRYDISEDTIADEITNANTLEFRATFSEPVINVDTSDFSVTGTTASVSSVVSVNSSVYEVTVSGGDLAALNGTVGLDLSGGQDITDAVGTNLPNGEPIIDETYIVDNIAPIVTINQASEQADPASATPVNFEIISPEEIDVSTFTVDDITQSASGTVSNSLITWSITDSGDHKTFTLSAERVAENGTLIPSIDGSNVMDLAGNPIIVVAGLDDTVTFNDNIFPTVTVNQASGQGDPTSALPIDFAVVFSEPIISSIFTTSDITQSGSATGITWSITNSGDDQNFTLSATSVTGTGTLIPSIAANRVTDIIGNDNLASTSTDNTVSYTKPPTSNPGPAATKTPTSFPHQAVVLNEVLPRAGSDWNEDGAIDVDDEFIEIINRGVTSVNLNGWKLDDEKNGGSDTYTLPNVTLNSGERIAIFGFITHISLSDGGDTVRLLKSNGQVADTVTYTVVKGADQSWCRLPEIGFWNPKCFPTPNEENTAIRNFSARTAELVVSTCLVPDTVPDEILNVECGTLGLGIWDADYWEGLADADRPVWLTGRSKWATWFR
ncbi:MAG: hypothetical protein B6I38_06815 [Anaerolineaceae bacterium 4572_5.1]|nr:MAG: hypothetical protein B6I38_06815 [Anaerolineaceae bacterium 4572_5.1]